MSDDLKKIADNLEQYQLKYPLTFGRLQDEVKAWAMANFGEQLPYRPLLGAVEEMGELAHAYLKMEQGIRGTREEHLEEAKDAVADVVIYLADFCNRMGFDYQALVEDVWKKVGKRNWIDHPEDADRQ